jgi:hypothetical protein
MSHVETSGFPFWLKPLGFISGICVAAWHGFDVEIFNRVVAGVGAFGSLGIGMAALWNAWINSKKARWSREDAIYARGLNSVSLTPVAAEPVTVPEPKA